MAKKRGRGSLTQQTERAGVAAETYNRLEELEQDGGLGAALVRDCFAESSIDGRSWRIMSLSEQTAGLSRIELKLASGAYEVTLSGHFRIILPPGYDGEKDRRDLYPRTYFEGAGQ